MPKMKTNSGTKKRFKVTATGKVLRNSAFVNHILTKKSKKQKRRLRGTTVVHKTNEGSVKRLLAIGG